MTTNYADLKAPMRFQNTKVIALPLKVNERPLR